MSDIRVRDGARGRRYQLRIPTGDPARPYTYRSFRTKRDAVSYRETLSTRRADGSLTSTATIGEALWDWIDACRDTGRHGREPVEASTLRMYEGHRSILDALKVDGVPLATAALGDVDGPFCSAVRKALLEAYSRAYAKKIWTSFKGALNQAVEDGRLRVNPAAPLMIRTSGRHEDGPVEIPTKAEMQKLLETARASCTWSTGKRSDGNVRAAWKRYYPLLLMRVYLGLRQSEVRGASWKDLDLEAGTFVVTQRADEANRIGPPKTKAARRTLYLPATVIEALKVWRPDCPLSPGQLLFPTRAGKPESEANLHNRLWVPLLERAGLVDDAGRHRYPFNACRHFNASLRIEQAIGNGDPLVVAKRVQEAMGHSSIQVTMDIYGHLFPRDTGEQRAAAQALEDALGS